MSRRIHLIARTSVALALLAAASMPALAVNPPYYTFGSGGTNTGTFTYDGKSISIAEAQGNTQDPNNPVFGQTQGPLGNLGNAVAKYYSDLETRLTTAAGQAATAAGLGFGQPPGHIGPKPYGVLRGPITLSVSSGAAPAYPAGTLKVTLSGLGYSFYVNGSTSKYGIHVDCGDFIDFNATVFTFYYNPINGAVLGADPAVLNPTQSVSCSSNLDWLPGFGDAIDNFAQSKTSSSVAGAINQWGGQLTSVTTGARFFGIENYIRPQQYVFNGFDAGAYIDNNLTAILQTSGTVSMKISYANYDGKTQDNWNKTQSVLTDTVFNLAFTNANHAFSFALTQTVNMNEEYDPRPDH